ncbi:Ger(x)C family spore germination C-terminal domain-containing protein [Paenibacillus rhizoplanae]
MASLFLTNSIDSATIAFASQPTKSDKLDASFILQNSATTVRPVWDKDHYVMNIEVKGSGVLTELGSVMDLNDRKAIREMEASLEQRVLSLVNDSWTEVKRLGGRRHGICRENPPERPQALEADRRGEKAGTAYFKRLRSARRSRSRLNGPASAINRSNPFNRSKGAYL